MAGEPKCPVCLTADNIAGVVVRGVYDGILYWDCMECGTKMHRFGPGTAYRDRAERYIQKEGIRVRG